MNSCFIALTILIFVGSTHCSIEVDKCTELFGTKEGTYGTASIEDVRVKDCTDFPCILKKGTEAAIEFDFIPDKEYSKLSTSVFAIWGGIIRVPFRGVDGANACKDVTRKRDGKKGCPLESNEVYTYSNTFPVLKIYPAVSVKVQYGLNEGKHQAVCFTLPVKILDP